MAVNARTIAIVADDEHRRRRRALPKGRAVDPAALAEVQQLLGSASRARDQLIEHLHLLQDAWRCLHDRHLVALAREIRLPIFLPAKWRHLPTEEKNPFHRGFFPMRILVEYPL